MSIAEADASAFVNRNAIDRTPIIRIFSTRNSVQLTAALDTLRQMYGHSAGKVDFFYYEHEFNICRRFVSWITSFLLLSGYKANTPRQFSKFFDGCYEVCKKFCELLCKGN